MPQQIALLRAINLGPSRRVAMPELRALLSAHGHADVRTFLGSGNVLLQSDADPADLACELERQIAAAMGFDAQVLIRTRDELAGVVARNPLAALADDPSRYQVSFLASELEPAVIGAIEGAALAEDAVVVSGREIFAWHANGIGRSPLANMLVDRKLGVSSTARNWTTVTRLLELADLG